MKSKDFISFYNFFILFLAKRKIQLKLRPFHKEVCDSIEAVFLGKLSYKIIIINISPRVGKTKLMEAFVLWAYGFFSDSHFIYASYSCDLATSSTRYVLSTMGEKWYQIMFGDIRGDIQKADWFNTKHGGVMKGDGTSGTLTGFGAGLKRNNGRCGGALICDDLQKAVDAHSKVVTESVQRWITQVMTSRLNSPNTPVIICAQRISEEDVCGYVLKNFPNETLHLKYPAMIDGISTIEDTKSTEDLKNLERVDPFAFYSQYQQDPIVLGGNIIKTEWFRYYDEDLEFDYKFFTVDTASKTKERNDFTVIISFGVIGKKLYIIDIMRAKLEAPDLETSARAFYSLYHPRIIEIEMKSSGIGLAQAMKRLCYPIKEIERNTDKYSRCLNAVPFIAAGVVHLRKGADYVVPFLSETAGFRADLGHAHDDQCDALFDGIEHLYGESASVLDSL